MLSFVCKGTLVILVDPVCGTSNGLDVSLIVTDQWWLCLVALLYQIALVLEERCVHTGPSQGSTSQPSCESDRPLCVHVLLSAGRRSSRSRGPWPMWDIFSTCARSFCPSCPPFHRSQNKVQAPFPRHCSWGVSCIFRYHPSRLVSSPSLSNPPIRFCCLRRPPKTKGPVHSRDVTVQQLSSHL